MRKTLFGLMSATMLFAASCTNEVEFLNEGGKTATVSFKVETPEIVSRAYSDGMTAKNLQYAVYAVNENGGNTTTTLLELSGQKALINRGTTVSLQLATGKKYQVLFWADADNSPYTFNEATQEISVNYSEATSNDESRDAFYACEEFTVNGANTQTVQLKRPFAQLNIGTNDYDAAAKAGFNPTFSKVTVENVYNTLNLATGAVDGEVKATFAYAAIAGKEGISSETFPVTGYDYLAMNYLLVGADKSVVDVTFSYAEDVSGAKVETRTVGSVPVQRNYRTNIYGKLLTSQTDINVEIKPGYETPDELVYVWDGSEVSKPKVSEEDANIYEITYASELAWLAAAVNGTLDESSRATAAADNFTGKTFRLTKDVDLGGKEWTPIGSSNHIFKGTFDGQGHTIKNLVVTGYNSNAGLFGVTHDGEIKNLVVENAKVSGRLNVGVVAGQPYTSKYTNITVKGHVEVNGMAYVGGVGGKNAYADWTDIKVEADETSYVKANSVENGTAYRTYVGGAVGFNGEGGHKFSNITSNIKVEGSTCDVGGLFGIAHYGNQFENLICTGDVEIYAAEESAEAEEVGGIAGVWMDSNEGSVTFTNTKFEGNVTTNVVRETIWYDNLIGKPYNNNGAGQLILNDYEMLANGIGLKDGEYFVFNADGLRWIATTVNAGKSFANETIKLFNDIDLSGAEWMPIGYGQKRFSGNFDGQDYTISGMTITEYNGQPQAALFGNIAGTTSFKNITIKDATVDMPDTHTGDFYAAGLIATYYGSVAIENVTVQNSTFTGNNKVAGLIAHDGVCSNVTIINTHVLGCTIKSENTTDGGNVGGMVGLFQSEVNYTISGSSVKGCTIVGINATDTGKRANGEFIACVTSKDGLNLVIEDCEVADNTFSQTTDGTAPVTYVGPYDNKFVGGERLGVTDLLGLVTINGAEYPAPPVAKVGNTEYKNIDEAIANWTHQTTLTLLRDVTLTDVIKLKSTEYRVLDLGTYTMTAASKKDAIEITAEGRSSASYALDIKADATNPGGITATGKAVVRTIGKSGVKDRPIIRFYNGEFNATNIINHSGSNGTNCPQFQFHNGVYNGTITANRALIQFYGGTFNGALMMSVDSSAYALISGGKFKQLSNLYMSALNADKFTIGSAKGVFDRGVYVDDEGYIVVGGPVITEFGDKFAAKATNASKAGSYLPYSSAATNGLYYTNAEMAIAKHGEANVILK